MKTIYFKTGLALIASSMIVGCGGGTSAEDDPYNQVNEVALEVVPFDAPPADEGTKTAFLNAINALRAQGRKCGDTDMPPAPPVRWNNALYLAAYEHSQDMAAVGYLGHDGSGTASDWTAQVQNLGRGSYFYERISTNGYNYSVRQENASKTGSGDPAYIVNFWATSPGHCEALMGAYHKEVGFARVGSYNTMEIASPR